ncbi:sensor histidine kinase [Streptomyces sp. SCA3-4]|uniref:sensor histidine kinase n=1 Tax=Streptomyces sichuanensis TaxID=2871810 RepID=UPI001CE270FC|nr:sensor histidine kinase [Streptomyces sichuanensis]MCA6090610.1 sensor histidine kinase [Streptomyces sichuanensis]
MSRPSPAATPAGAPAHGPLRPGASLADVRAGFDVPSLRLVRLALHGAFFALLLVALGPALLGDGSPAVLPPACALAVVYGAGLVRRGRRPGVSLAAVTALWLLLLALDHGFSYLAFPLFFHFLRALPVRWAHAAVAAATAAVVAAQAAAPGGLTVAKVIGPAAGAAAALLTGYGYAALSQESRRRQRLIDDLVRTRDELAAAQREAGRLAERQRLAREIHDTLAQGLSSIVLLARAAETAAPATVPERVREIGRTASDNLAEARRFVHALVPPALAEAPLPEALRRVTARTLPGAVFRLDGEPCPLPVECEVALLRLTQEALANVARHARAEHTAVTLAYLDGQVTLDVYDDGVGFIPGEGPADGRRTFGLHGMRERIAELGGTLTVESAPGEGTAVAVAVPLGAEGPGGAGGAGRGAVPAQADDRGQAAGPARAGVRGGGRVAPASGPGVRRASPAVPAAGGPGTAA